MSAVDLARGVSMNPEGEGCCMPYAQHCLFDALALENTITVEVVDQRLVSCA